MQTRALLLRLQDALSEAGEEYLGIGRDIRNPNAKIAAYVMGALSFTVRSVTMDGSATWGRRLFRRSRINRFRRMKRRSR